MLVLIFLLGLFVPIGSVKASDAIVISNLQIDIRPEYDRSIVLVIYRIQLSEDTVLPATLQLSIPEEAIRPARLAVEDLDGMFYDINFTSEQNDKDVSITFITPSRDVQLEYYDPRLAYEDTLRSYSLCWQIQYPVRTFTVRVQKPVHTTRMTITPDIGSSQMGQDGMEYYLLQAGSLEANEPFTIALEYEKPDFILSSGLQPVSPIDPISVNTRGRTTVSRGVPWALALLGVILIVTGGIWYWRIDRRGPAKELNTPPIEPTIRSIKQAQQLISQTYMYCNHCGKRLQRTDQFCRECGHQVDFR